MRLFPFVLSTARNGFLCNSYALYDRENFNFGTTSQQQDLAASRADWKTWVLMGSPVRVPQINTFAGKAETASPGSHVLMMHDGNLGNGANKNLL